MKTRKGNRTAKAKTGKGKKTTRPGTGTRTIANLQIFQHQDELSQPENVCSNLPDSLCSSRPSLKGSDSSQEVDKRVKDPDFAALFSDILRIHEPQKRTTPRCISCKQVLDERFSQLGCKEYYCPLCYFKVLNFSLNQDSAFPGNTSTMVKSETESDCSKLTAAKVKIENPISCATIQESSRKISDPADNNLIYNVAHEIVQSYPKDEIYSCKIPDEPVVSCMNIKEELIDGTEEPLLLLPASKKPKLENLPPTHLHKLLGQDLPGADLDSDNGDRNSRRATDLSHIPDVFPSNYRSHSVTHRSHSVTPSCALSKLNSDVSTYLNPSEYTESRPLRRSGRVLCRNMYLRDSAGCTGSLYSIPEVFITKNDYEPVKDRSRCPKDTSSLNVRITVPTSKVGLSGVNQIPKSLETVHSTVVDPVPNQVFKAVPDDPHQEEFGSSDDEPDFTTSNNYNEPPGGKNSIITKTYECPVCPESFTHTRRYHKHIWKHGKEKSFGCEACDQKFETAGALCAHELTHMDSTDRDKEGNLRCRGCNVITVSFAELEKHACFSLREFGCPHCPLVFAGETPRDEHTRSHSTEKKKKGSHFCTLCNKMFSLKNTLLQHNKVDHQGLAAIKGTTTYNYKRMKRFVDHCCEENETRSGVVSDNANVSLPERKQVFSTKSVRQKTLRSEIDTISKPPLDSVATETDVDDPVSKRTRKRPWKKVVSSDWEDLTVSEFTCNEPISDFETNNPDDETISGGINSSRKKSASKNAHKKSSRSNFRKNDQFIPALFDTPHSRSSISDSVNKNICTVQIMNSNDHITKTPIQSEMQIDILQSEKESRSHQSEKQTRTIQSEKDTGTIQSEKEAGKHQSEQKIGMQETEQETGTSTLDNNIDNQQSEQGIGMLRLENKTETQQSEKEYGMHQSKRESGKQQPQVNLKQYQLVDKIVESIEDSKSQKHNTCDKVFSKTVQLLHHNNTHKDEKEFKCETCTKSWYRNENFNIHRCKLPLKPPLVSIIGSKKIKCPACPRVILRNAFERHLRLHTVNKTFGCDACSHVSKTAGAMSAHKLTHNNINTTDGLQATSTSNQQSFFKCSVCNLASRTVLELEKHICYNLTKRFKCLQCPETFFIKSKLAYHVRRQHSKMSTKMVTDRRRVFHDSNESASRDLSSRAEMWNCTTCSKVFKGNRKRNYVLHIWNHGKKKDFRCKFCGETFATAGNMCAHELIHKNINPDEFDQEKDGSAEIGQQPIVYKCTACRIPAATVFQLESHICFNISEVSCPHCPKVFPYQHKLEVHARTHLSERKIFSCPDCDKAFLHKSTLVRHKKVFHKGIKYYRCKICKKKFWLLENFQEHKCKKRKIYYTYQPVECRVCHKTLNNAQCLKQHMHIHTSEKKIMCETCGKRFKTTTTFKTHALTHSSERFQMCDFCAKSFKSIVTLKRHVGSVHNKSQNSYHCDICNKDFTPKDNYVRHLRTHTGEKPYECRICGHRAIQYSSLKSHIRVHHKDAVVADAMISHLTTKGSV